MAGLRLRGGRLTVIDATNVQAHARAALVRVAREHDVLPVAIVLDVPEDVCWERTQVRPDRDCLAALDRVAAGEPLWRVHEPVFAILACESDPVDPRL